MHVATSAIWNCQTFDPSKRKDILRASFPSQAYTYVHGIRHGGNSLRAGRLLYFNLNQSITFINLKPLFFSRASKVFCNHSEQRTKRI